MNGRDRRLGTPNDPPAWVAAELARLARADAAGERLPEMGFIWPTGDGRRGKLLALSEAQFAQRCARLGNDADGGDAA